MTCEQVEELLSAYLDNALASEERREVAAHLRQCSHCSTVLADFRRFDALLSQMPRVSPDSSLRERIFSELTGTDGGGAIEDSTLPRVPARLSLSDKRNRPQLVAIPGGRSTDPRVLAHSVTQKYKQVSPSKRQRSRGLVMTLIAVAAVIAIMLGFGGIITLHPWAQQAQTADIGAITPPAAQQPGGPLSAGLRYVFLRNESLWSTLADGSSQAEPLTPASVMVSSNWVVSPPLPGRSAGDRIAYIDLQTAYVHMIRSDGQQDTIVKQPLLKTGVVPASIWDTDTGTAILNGLAWSKDGSMLAFVADPTGTGQTRLYIDFTETGMVQMVPVTSKGSISHPVWSPDGVRLAFELAANGVVSILDYNTQNHGLLDLTEGVRIQTGPDDAVLSLDWSPDADRPVVTWSMGTIGHVHSIWSRHVGVGETVTPQLLVRGDFAQAIYSRAGHGEVGSWLLVTAVAGRPADLERVDVLPGAAIIPLTSGKQVNFAWWSPNGAWLDYLDSISSGVGMLHVVNVMTGVDTLVAKGVANDPAPVWSVDSQRLAYSTGAQTFVVSTQAGSKPVLLHLQGPAFALLWSVGSPHELVAALGDGHQGVYVVDTQRNMAVQVDKQGISGSIQWTLIP